MRKIFLFSTLVVIALSVFVSANEKGDSRRYIIVEGVKIVGENRTEALFYYRNNWAKFRETAVKKDLIDSFELVETKSNEGGADIYLITRFANKKQFDEVEKNFRKIIDSGGGLKLLNDKKPKEFRKFMFASTGRSEY